MADGWIKLYRQFRDSPYYKESHAKAVWIECLLRANHNESKQWLKRQHIKLQPGEFVMGGKEFAEVLGLSKSTVWFWLNQFITDGMLDAKKTTKGSILSIKNWSKYQSTDALPVKEKSKKNPRKDYQKNVKKEKNVKKKTTTVEADAFGNADINWLMDEFTKAMGFSSMGKKLQDRRMASHLLREFSREQIAYMLKYCATDQYAPRIGSVEKLWYKRGDIIAAIKAKKTQTKNNDIAFIS